MQAYTFVSHIGDAVIEHVRQVRTFEKIQGPEELEFPFEITGKDLKLDREQNVLRQPRKATQVICVSSVSRIFISVETQWSTKYVGDALKLIYNCHISKAPEEYGAVKLLRGDVPVINVTIKILFKHFIVVL